MTTPTETINKTKNAILGSLFLSTLIPVLAAIAGWTIGLSYVAFKIAFEIWVK